MNTSTHPQELSNLTIIKKLHEVACAKGDLESLTQLYHDSELFPVGNSLHHAWLSFIGVFKATPDFQVMEGKGFTLACKNGHLPIIDFLLNSAKYKDVKVISLGCLGAIAHGHLDIANLLIPNVVKNQIFDSICHKVLSEICSNGNLESLRYLLTNKKLDIQVDKLLNSPLGDFEPAHQGFIDACEDGQLDIVKYLTSSPELTHHVKLDEIKNEVNITNPSIIRHFIFDLNLERDHNLFKRIKFPDKQLVESLFEKKELFENLSSDGQSIEEIGNVGKRKYKL